MCDFGFRFTANEIFGAIFTQRPPSVSTKQSLFIHIKGLLHPQLAKRGGGQRGSMYLTIRGRFGFIYSIPAHDGAMLLFSKNRDMFVFRLGV